MRMGKWVTQEECGISKLHMRSLNLPCSVETESIECCCKSVSKHV